MADDLLALVEQDGFRAVRKSTSRGGQYNGPCPWCQGTDRFRVQPHAGTYGFFACSVCQRKGSAIDYLMQRRGFTRREALAAVGWTPGHGKSAAATIPGYAYHERPRWEEPAEQWQEAAISFLRSCQATLWSERGRIALDYLRGRGLTETTIQRAALGYHPEEAYGPAGRWSRAVRLPQGIVIPWLSAGKVWRLTMRDERIAAGADRYRQVAGGSNGLYLADSLTLKRAAVIVTEGELDALSVAQECGDLVAVVATGTTQGGHTPRWVSKLSAQRQVLVAFDAEEAGDRAALWWLRRLANAQRLRPLWKDANQMLQDGVDLRAWITPSCSTHAPGAVPSCPSDEAGSTEKATAGPGSGSSQHPALSDIPQAFLERPCRRCGSHDARQDEDGRWLCPCYWTYRTKAMLTQAQLKSSVPQLSGVYTPGILPASPRRQCPFEVVVVGKDGCVAAKTCTGVPLPNGWCETHQRAQELLELGARLGYPRLQVTRYRTIGGGKACWEAYATRATESWLTNDLPLIRKRVVQQQSAA